MTQIITLVLFSEAYRNFIEFHLPRNTYAFSGFKSEVKMLSIYSAQI